MILKSQIEGVIDNQLRWLHDNPEEVRREQLATLVPVHGLANIVAGIRRCGKSTLLAQLMAERPQEETLYLNFEDIHLTGFDATDFQRLHGVITDRRPRALFFDEPQLVDRWEVFVHQLLREGYEVFVTGSNASMLSVELGTHLTGRHLSTELFPFSYGEYLSFTRQERGEASFARYLVDGGMPEYLSTRDKRVLATMIDDILIRDIAIRHGIRNVAPLRQLAAYLLTNIGKPFSGNRLTSVAGDIAPSTVLEYIDYMRDAYLVDTLGLYSTKPRATARNPKKVYTIDNGLSVATTMSATADTGRLLENHLFLQLRRRAKGHLFYYRGQGECDFVVTASDNRPSELYQACLHLTADNLDREISGLREAMRDFGLRQGTIVTLSDRDTLTVPEGSVRIVRAYEANL